MTIKHYALFLLLASLGGMVVNCWYHDWSLWNGWEGFIDGACMFFAGIGFGSWMISHGIDTMESKGYIRVNQAKIDEREARREWEQIGKEMR